MITLPLVVPAAPPRVMRTWGGHLSDHYRPVPEVRCDGAACGSQTRFYTTECVVLTMARRFWEHKEAARHITPADRQPFDPEADVTLPSYDHPVLVRINRWAVNKDAADLSRLTQSHRRFMFYYYFAVDIFGAVERIRLPECVLAAVRHQYPQLVTEIDYVGHRD